MTRTQAALVAGFIAGSTAFGAGTSPAFAQNQDLICVQQQLADRGFDPGPADGVMGGLTRSAAEIYAVLIPNDLPAIATATADDWCEALQTAAEDRIGFQLTGTELSEIIFGRTHTTLGGEVIVIGGRGAALRTVPGQEPVADRIYSVEEDTMCTTMQNAEPVCSHIYRRGENEFVPLALTGEVGAPFAVE